MLQISDMNECTFGLLKIHLSCTRPGNDYDVPTTMEHLFL